MTIVTLPADIETERLAQKIATATGKPLPTIVREAIAASAEAAGVAGQPGRRLSGAELLARMTEISDHCASLPVLDDRTADEIIGYDEYGVPR